jgi:hypothetical protein
MSRFKEEFSLISPAGKLIAFLVWLAATVGLNVLFLTVGKPGDPPVPFRIFLTLFIPIPLTLYALVVAYIHGDAKRRGMRHVLWTLLAIFIPNGIGIILYFIFREPRMIGCPKCGAHAKQTFAFCPGCGAALQPACPACRKAVEPGWANCPYCGGRLAG